MPLFNNNEMQSITIPPLIKDLIEGYSNHNKSASKLWTTLAIVSIISIIPNEITQSIEIPIINKVVSKELFYFLSAIFISTMLIAFTNLQVQTIRSRKFIQRVINQLENKYLVPDSIHIQDVVDCIISSSLNRVAPLAQFLQGKNQFYPESDNRSKTVRVFTYSYYFIAKTITVLVYYGLPLFGITECLTKGTLLNPLLSTFYVKNYLYYPFILFAVSSVIPIIVAEFSLILDVKSRIIDKSSIKSRNSQSKHTANSHSQ